MHDVAVRPSLVWLGEASATDPALVGPKAAHLATLAEIANVPAGFCLTTEAHRAANGVASMPAELAAAVAEAYERLTGTTATAAVAPVAVAVRSSAVDEDGRGASFAGQHDTFLNIGSLDGVIEAIGRTWRSLGSDAALAYRRRLGVSADSATLAVLVQRMVPADAAGVAFSIDPVTGATDRMIVSASWGLGESVVGGTVSPDTWTLDKATLATVEERLGSKERMTIAVDGGTREVAVPAFLRSRPALTSDELRSLAITVRDLEAHMGWPVDVEFAVADGHVHVLQCRPVTAVGDGTHIVAVVGHDGGASSVRADGAADGLHEAPGLPPIEWADPSDAERFWQRDLGHFPEPYSTLDGDVMGTALEGGFARAIEMYGLDYSYRNRRIWGHYYFSAGPLGLTEAEREERRDRERRVLDPLLDDLPHAWTNRWLPEIEAHLTALQGVDLVSAGPDQLVRDLDDALARLARLWQIHFELIPADIARRRFVELHDDLFGRDDPMRADVLLRGFDAMTTRAGRAIWRLRPLAEIPEVASVLRSRPPGEALAALGRVPAAAALLAAFTEVVRIYGMRSQALSLSSPTLFEDPAPLVQALRDALDRPEADPDRTLRDHAAERAAALDDSMAALAAYPRPVRDEFVRRLRAARAGMRLTEDHSFLIDYGATAAVRSVFIEIGRRLAADGLLTRPDDVVHLTAAEIRSTLLAGGPDRRDLVAERAVEQEHFARLGVPRTIGTRPEPASPAATVRSKDAGAALHIIVGEAASPGVVRGRVRVVRTFAGAAQLEPGEVLVAPTTSQAWTPLFATAGALVTEAGGRLSHSAVVAREYGLPAVVGAAGVLGRVRDGMVVEVDGGRGTVRIVAWR